MAVPLAIPVRERIIQAHEAGKSLREISRQEALSYWTVRTLWQHYVKTGKIAPSYEACGRRGIRASQRVYRGAMYLRHAHPTWGAPLIRLLLHEKWAEEYVPSSRTLQRWFRQAGCQGRRLREKGERLARGGTPHAVWEMDAKEQIPLASGERVSWLVVSDEASGAILGGRIFPPESVE